MLFRKIKILAKLIGLFIFLLLVYSSVSKAPEKTSIIPYQSNSYNSSFSEGYNDIVKFRDKVIAVGTGGQIDCISASGEKTAMNSSCKSELNCACSDEEMLIAAGDNGTILYSINGEIFYRAESGINNTIHGITVKNRLIIAGTDNGMILYSKDGKTWNKLSTGAKGNVLSVSSNNSFFIGITSMGEIIKSTDGTNWEIKDFNKEYEGYYLHTKFKKILATEKSIVIIGSHDDGSPAVLYSTLGNVWSERVPVYHDDEGKIYYLTQEPNGLTYDPEREQFILTCNNGELFVLPSCTKCNKSIKIAEENLKALLYLNDNLYIVGENFSVFTQKL